MTSAEPCSGGNGHANGTSNTTNFLHSMARSMPPMMQIMKDIGGVELPEFIAKLTPDGKPAAGESERPASNGDGVAGKKG